VSLSENYIIQKPEEKMKSCTATKQELGCAERLLGGKNLTKGRAWDTG
jgi:hypothetical protein